MNRWAYRKIFLFFLLTLLCASAGAFLAGKLGFSRVTGFFAGACLGCFIAWFIEIWQANRLLSWLSDIESLPTSAQRLQRKGYWALVSSHIVRLLRKKDKQLKTYQQQIEQFLAALQVAPTGILLLDKDNYLLWGNRSASIYFDLSFPKDYAQQITHLVRQPEILTYLQNQHQRVEPLQIKCGLQEQYSLLLTVTQYDEKQHKLLLIQDVSEQERTDQMRRDLVANVSHEMRTPLTVLTGFIETMQNLPLTEEEKKDYLFLMAEQSNRMNYLVTDLLTLAKLESSPIPDTQNWISIETLMAQVKHAAIQLCAQKHDITFVTDEASFCDIGGEETEIISAMSNLVSNAIRHTPKESKIKVIWRLLPERKGEFSVHDNGPGIAKEHLARLTERFYRVDRSRSRQTGGTGLGLSIIKHVMQRHGGSLEIESIVGQGSVFRLVFPASRIKINHNVLTCPD